MRIVFIVGARPQFIKLAPLFSRLPDRFDKTIIHTGQHYDKNMSKLFFNELNIPEPNYNLGIGSGSQGAQTGQMLKDIENVLLDLDEKSLTIIFGDTNSTLAGALASAKLDIPIIHIEAGLRSFNRQMPEEINRVVADHTSDYLFAPTPTAIKNLKNEGLKARTYHTGDIMVDSIYDFSELAEHKSAILSDLDIKSKEYSLLTLHRPYNVDNRQNIDRILTALSKLEEQIIFPVHPRTQKVIESFDMKMGDNITLIDPQGYLDFILLQKNARMILTDSGGIQKEAYVLGIPCITLRYETEWTETVKTGWNLLLPPDSEELYQKIKSFNPDNHKPDIFGNNVSSNMIKIIESIVNE